MKIRMHHLVPLSAASLATTLARAQSGVLPTAKFAWSENCGYLNFRDAGTPAGNQGVEIVGDHLRGFIWGENIGWINVGNGSGPYPNTDGTNFGVNLNLSTGSLTGFAWGENVGWINFSGGALATPANPARLDLSTYRLHGFAWGENIGWINLDDATTFVGFTCPADIDDGSATGTPDASVDISDLLYYLQLFDAGDPAADFDDGSGLGLPDGGVDISDLLYFLARFDAGC